MDSTNLPEDVLVLRALIEEKEALLEQERRAGEQLAAALAASQREAARLALLNELSQQIGLAESEPAFYRIAALYASRIFPVIDRASVALITPAGDGLELFALQGNAASLPVGTRLPFEATVVGLTVRERRVVVGEQERAALKEQIIEAQQRRLKEMSTPLIPISDSVMVMPLIGTMDAARAEQVLDTALHVAKERGVEIVIIDITGMQQVDSYAAGSLINTANALRLLGAKTVITGVRPEVARTLVGLGIELGTIMTRRTLQSAITYALARSRRE